MTPPPTLPLGTPIPGQPEVRYHALDSMRASMMLLGIYLHVVVGYSGDGNWPYIDPHPTPVLNFTLGIIHAFRMPAFYVMAGFFGALLWSRRGPAAFVSNRLKRILLPLALFWSLLFPPMAVVVISRERGADQVIPAFTSGEILGRLHPMHLWFLEYLLLLYALGGGAAWLGSRTPLSFRERILQIARRLLVSPFAPFLGALFSWPALAGMRGNLKDCDGFLPEPLILLAYVVPFFFGWLLYHLRDLLPRFERHVGLYLLLAVPAFLGYKFVSRDLHPFLKASANVLLCWLLIFACTGIFLRYLANPNPRVRFLSDASYWMFIMHMPVVVGLQVLLRPVPLPALLKIPVVLALSILILLASYDAWVRPSWIGVLLNGRRYPRFIWPDRNAPLPTHPPQPHR